jgi:hypothetical protein
VGYLRSKIYSRSVLNKTLIDSGNLFGDLISEEFAILLKLPITGCPKTVGTASTNGSVTILGKTKPLKLYLEGISEAVTIHPYVVKNLSHPLNLGQSFLRANNVDMSFRENGVQLRIKNSTSMLDPSDSSLTKPTIDSRIKLLLDKFKADGENPWSAQADILDLRINQVGSENPDSETIPGVFYKENKKSIEFSDTSTRVCNSEKAYLKAGHTTVVLLQRGRGDLPAQPLPKQGNDVFLFPKKTNKWLNNKQLFVHPGTYHREGNFVKVQVTNFGSDDQYLPKHCHVGNIVEAIHHSKGAINTLDHRPTHHLSEAELVERRAYIIHQLKLDENLILAQHPEAKDEVIKIFMDGWDAIAINEADYGLTNMMKFHIEVPKGTIPVRDRVRPLNPMQEKDLRRQIDDWLEAKVIEPSNSPWASALVPCKKKGSEKYRWAIDYRKLNSVTVKDAFPLSNIENNLQKLAGTSIFSTLDSAGAFHTIPVHEEHRDFTAFNTPFGQYRFCRLPFGLANAPSAYSRLVQMALDHLPPGFAMGYIDDIIAHSRTVEDHLTHLRQIVMLHVSVGMKLNLQKCNIFHNEVQYLGHLVSADGIRMIPSYVQRIMDWPLPKTGKELRSFLGFTGYYRSFIKEYAHLTHEMNKMKSGVNLEWCEATQKKFQQLKECFQAEPVRGYPQYDNLEPFILDTDYSSTNMAAVLSQKQNGKEVFLGCVAKKCNTAQASYAPHKGELAAVILGTKKFEHILRAKPFVIRTDSRCVQFLNSMKEFRGIYARWNCFLSSFQFTLEHRAGKKQTNADALSRRPGIPDDPDENNDDPNEYLHDIDDIYSVDPDPIAVITLETLKDENSKDMAISKLLQQVVLGEKPDKEKRKTLGSIGMSYVNVFECLSAEDGVLYYQAPELNDVQPERRICLPVSLYNLAFEMCHADPSGVSGHFGINNTFRKMKERFYFPHMYAQVSARINNCVPCITKRSTIPKGEHKHHREQLSYFNQRVYCDVVGVLTGSPYQGRTCRFLLTIQDGFTRYLIAVPIPDQKTETIVQAFIDNWIYVFGCMETLHTDRGSSYTSTLFQEVMRALGIVKTVTPAYSPEGDRVERAHRVLGDLLRADRRYEAHRWTDKLKAALLAYNASVNRITGISPFEAVFHRPITLPVDIVFPFKKQEGQSWSTHVENLKLKLSQLCEAICKTQQTGIMRENSRFQGRSKPQFQEGDLCYYFLPRVKRGLSKKLSSHWIGPWKVKKVISESLVILYPVGNWCATPREISAIVNRLKQVDPDIAATCTRQDDKLDLEVLSDDLDHGAEYLMYQEDFESVVPNPLVGFPTGPQCPSDPSHDQGTDHPNDLGQGDVQPPPDDYGHDEPPDDYGRDEPPGDNPPPNDLLDDIPPMEDDHQHPIEQQQHQVIIQESDSPPAVPSADDNASEPNISANTTSASGDNRVIPDSDILRRTVRSAATLAKLRIKYQNEVSKRRRKK